MSNWDWHYTLGVGVRRCANGETHEFFLTLDGDRLDGKIGLLRTMLIGDSVPDHVRAVLPQLVMREVVLDERGRNAEGATH